VPKVLLAATAVGGKQLSIAIMGVVDLHLAHDYQMAISCLAEPVCPDLVIVSYHFDQLRPYRLVQQMKDDGQTSMIPILLVRALPLHLGTPNAAQLKDAYIALGVTDFIDVEDVERKRGRRWR
jgi:PleD family two-component response regulator